MYAKIQKWGNSHAVRLPKAILEKVDLKEDDQVELVVRDGNLLIVPVERHKTLKDRITEYKGDYQPREWQTGEPKGKEVF